MEIFHYLPPTNEYIGTGEADPDPLDKGQYLIPACATTEKPPQAGEYQTAVFENGNWSLVDDYRGEVFWLDHYNKWAANDLGEVPPENAQRNRPDAPEPTLKEKQAQIDDTRRSLYVKYVDPLVNEGSIKRAMGDTDAADALMQQAINERQRIQSENPWPE